MTGPADEVSASATPSSPPPPPSAPHDASFAERWAIPLAVLGTTIGGAVGTVGGLVMPIFAVVGLGVSQNSDRVPVFLLSVLGTILVFWLVALGIGFAIAVPIVVTGRRHAARTEAAVSIMSQNHGWTNAIGFVVVWLVAAGGFLLFGQPALRSHGPLSQELAGVLLVLIAAALATGQWAQRRWTRRWRARVARRLRETVVDTCRACGHDVRTVPTGGTCPECGCDRLDR